MAKIVDPDSIQQGTEVIYDTTLKTIQLSATGASAISDESPGKTSGITGKCLYSFTKEEWKDDTALNKFKFPIKMIYEASFQLINGWEFADDQTRDVIRDAGFQEINLSDEYSCMISLGDIDNPAVDQAYYTNTTGLFEATAVFDKTGELNENILVYDGTTDTRDYLKLFLREQGKLYAEYDLHAEQGLAAVGYEAYKFPLSNGSDIKVTLQDAALSGTPYDDMLIDYIVGTGFTTGNSVSAGISASAVYQDGAGRWAFVDTGGTLDVAGVADWTANGGTAVLSEYDGERLIGSDYYAFNRIVAASGATVEETHMWCQYQLRLDENINDDITASGFGNVRGSIAIPLTSFIGDQLHTNPGMYVDDLDLNDNNDITYWDITVDGGGLDTDFVPVTSTQRNNPFFASFSLVFSQNLVDETNADTLYRVYFTNNDAGDDDGSDFDTANAITVKDKDLADITGQITQVTNTFQYDYTGNVQRGAASAGSPAPITVVYQGLFDSEWSFAQFTIQQSTGQSFACNTSDELNYDNP